MPRNEHFSSVSCSSFSSNTATVTSKLEVEGINIVEEIRKMITEKEFQELLYQVELKGIRREIGDVGFYLKNNQVVSVKTPYVLDATLKIGWEAGQASEHIETLPITQIERTVYNSPYAFAGNLAPDYFYTRLPNGEIFGDNLSIITVEEVIDETDPFLQQLACHYGIEGRCILERRFSFNI